MENSYPLPSIQEGRGLPIWQGIEDFHQGCSDVVLQPGSTFTAVAQLQSPNRRFTIDMVSNSNSFVTTWRGLDVGLTSFPGLDVFTGKRVQHQEGKFSSDNSFSHHVPRQKTFEEGDGESEQLMSTFSDVKSDLISALLPAARKKVLRKSATATTHYRPNSLVTDIKLLAPIGEISADP